MELMWFSGGRSNSSSTLEEMGHVEPPPLSPSVLVELPPTPCGDQEGASMEMEYISRMLMEEEEDDGDGRVDQSALIQAQQSLARIISSSSSSSTSMDGRAEVEAGHNWSNAVNMSFLMGMVEASKFLPRTDGNSLVSMKMKQKRAGGHGVEPTSRASKLAAMAAPEEVQEMVNRMMLSDCEVSREELQGLRAAIDGEARAWPRKQLLLQVDLRTLLVRCAETAMDDDHRGARELLAQVKQHASPTGDATQRLAHCFAAALEARLAGAAVHRRPAPTAVKFLEAYRLYVATCCFKKVAFAFANQTICRAAAGRSRLHIVDYGVGFGFQWPGLLRLLAAREGGPPAVTITGIDVPQPGFRPAGHIEETGRQLSNCARELGVPFTFQAIVAGRWDAVRVEDLAGGSAAATALVVNSLFRLETLADDSVVVDRPSPRDTVIAAIRRMRPAVFTHGVVNGFFGASFLTRFREALFFYSAMFDVLDATMPRGSPHRLLLERDILAPFAMNIVACEGRDRTDRSDSYKQWQLRIQRAGLRQLPLDRAVVAAIRDMVHRQQYHKDFVVDEDRRWLLQGWKGRILYAHSTWVADDDPCSPPS